MRRLLMFVAAVVVTSGFAVGGEPTQPNENLKGFGPFIGTWRYEGPVLEVVENIAEKGSKMAFQLSWRWILDKQVVMSDWQVKLENGATFAGKSIVGWNAAEEKIIIGYMNSMGGMGMGTTVLDAKAKTSTDTSKGVDGDGNETSSKGVITKVDKDTLTWQAFDRTGGLVQGDSPIYTFKRVKRTKAKKAAK